MMQYKVLLLTSGKSNIVNTIKKIIKLKKNFFSIKAICSDKDLDFNKDIYFLNTKNTKSEKKILKIINKNEINFILSFTYKWLVSEKVLKSVNYRAFNIHGAKLSQYRGNHTSIFPILDSRKNTYVEVHHMNKFCDSGKVIITKKIKISDDDTGETLSNKIIKTGSNLLKIFLTITCKNKNFLENFIKNISHDKKLSSKFGKTQSIHKLKKINNLHNLKEVISKTRAFDWINYEPAYIILNKQKIYLRFKK